MRKPAAGATSRAANKDRAARSRSRSARASADPVFADGVKVRREMWGHEGAEGQIDAASDFLWPMQEAVTLYCFGQTWTRPGLSRKARSMITLGILVSQGRPHEIKVHVRGAIANGLTKEEIREVMLHAMVYSGIPRGVEGFRCAE